MDRAGITKEERSERSWTLLDSVWQYHGAKEEQTETAATAATCRLVKLTRELRLCEQPPPWGVARSVAALAERPCSAPQRTAGSSTPSS